MKNRRTLLSVERLEDRCTPASWGNPWPDPQHLTLSFAPDGTSVGGQSSNLFHTMSALGPTSAWQTAILRALQTWAVETNVNIGVVADQGLPFGTAGAIQGDPRFGDIRIGAYPMAATAEAFGSPFDIDAGTWSGDVFFNSNTSFGLNGQNYDLFTVALHEAGHVFGLPDQSTNPTSVMYVNYMGPRTGLSPSDISAIQAILGAPLPEAGNNNQIGTATPLNLLTNADGSLGFTATAKIASLQDSDFYAFNTLLNLGGADITVQTGGLSLLTPAVTVYDAHGNVVGSAVSTNPLQGSVVVHLSNVRAFSTYYVEVSSGQQNVFGVGSYQLTVHELPVVNGLVGFLSETLNQVVTTATTFLTQTLPMNNNFATAMNLTPESGTGEARFDYAYRGYLGGSSDTQYFRIQAPAAGSGGQSELTAMVSGLDANGLVPRVKIFDAHDKPVAGEVVVNDGSSYTIQIPNTIPGASYYAEVLSPNSKNSNSTGDYFLGLAFSLRAVNLQTLAAGTVSGSQQGTNNLSLTQSQMFHFVLSAGLAGGGGTGGVQMSIVNSAGQVVFTMTASSAEPVSSNVILAPGNYTLEFAAVVVSGGSPPALNYLLQGTNLSDPQGPESTDPTGDPSGSYTAPPQSPPSSTSGPSSSGVPPQDPSSNPYSTTSPPPSSSTSPSPSSPPPPAGTTASNTGGSPPPSSPPPPPPSNNTPPSSGGT